MIYLTFYHGWNIFRGNEFVFWIKDNFKSVKFEGFEYGHYLPMISVSLDEFEAKKGAIPLMNLVRIEGRFDVFQKLCFGVRNFKNEISGKVEKAKKEFVE